MYYTYTATIKNKEFQKKRKVARDIKEKCNSAWTCVHCCCRLKTSIAIDELNNTFNRGESCLTDVLFLYSDVNARLIVFH